MLRIQKHETIPVGNRLETNIDVRSVEFPVSLLTIGKVNPSHERSEETGGLPFLDSYLNYLTITSHVRTSSYS